MKQLIAPLAAFGIARALDQLKNKITSGPGQEVAAKLSNAFDAFAATSPIVKSFENHSWAKR